MNRIILGFVFVFSLIASEALIAQRNFIQSARSRKMHRHHLNEIVLKFNNGEEGHAWVSHQGKPKLLLLHGITGNAEVQYARNASKLSKHYDVIALDLKFHGESKNIPQGYSIQDQVHWVAECMLLLSQLHNDEGYQKVHVVGNSYGGIVAGIFADQYPNMTSQLTMIDAPIRFFGASMADSIAHSVGLQDFFDLLSPTNAAVFNTRTKLSLHRKIWVPRFVANQIIENDLKPRRVDHEQLVDDLRKSEEYWISYNFQWNCKVNIFWGDADRLIPLEVGRKQAEYFKGINYTELEKVGHVWNMERPKQFNQWLIKNQNRYRTLINPSF